MTCYLWMLVLFFVYDKMIINTCLPSVPILYPLGTSKKISFSDFFRGYKKRTLGRNGLKYICCMNFVLLRVFLCFLYWYCAVIFLSKLILKSKCGKRPMRLTVFYETFWSILFSQTRIWIFQKCLYINQLVLDNSRSPENIKNIIILTKNNIE